MRNNFINSDSTVKYGNINIVDGEMDSAEPNSKANTKKIPSMRNNFINVESNVEYGNISIVDGGTEVFEPSSGANPDKIPNMRNNFINNNSTVKYKDINIVDRKMDVPGHSNEAVSKSAPNTWNKLISARGNMDDAMDTSEPGSGANPKNASRIRNSFIIVGGKVKSGNISMVYNGEEIYESTDGDNSMSTPRIRNSFINTNSTVEYGDINIVDGKMEIFEPGAKSTPATDKADIDDSGIFEDEILEEFKGPRSDLSTRRRQQFNEGYSNNETSNEFNNAVRKFIADIIQNVMGGSVSNGSPENCGNPTKNFAIAQQQEADEGYFSDETSNEADNAVEEFVTRGL